MDPLTASIEANWSEFLTLLSEVMQIASVKGEPVPHAPYGTGPREVLAYVMEKAQHTGFKQRSLMMRSAMPIGDQRIPTISVC